MEIIKTNERFDVWLWDPQIYFAYLVYYFIAIALAKLAPNACLLTSFFLFIVPSFGITIKKRSMGDV